MTGFLLLGMWVAFIFGMGTNDVIRDHKAKNPHVQMADASITIEIRSDGKTIKTCEEKKP